jgi:uncharacterized protein YukE
MATARTDFSAYSHQALVAMLHDSDPTVTAATADAWSSVGTALHDQAGALEHTLQSFDGIWQGDAANAYHAMIGDLANGIRQTATSALAIRDLVHHATDALNTARAAMPDPVDVPVPPVLSRPTAAPSMLAANLTDHTALAEQRAQAMAQVQQQQQVLAAAASAHAQAVIVMTDLANEDTAIDAALPPAPAATVPTVAADGTVQPNATGAAVNASASGPAPLFSQVFRAGLAAAGMAAGGRFGPALVKLAPSPAAANTKATTASTKLPKLGGIGAGGADLSPVASPSLAGSATTAEASGLTVPTGATGTTASAGGYMPPMGYGMAGADDGMGSGRRIPPWLVETEDVWGESSTVTPGIIGEESNN